MDIPLVDVTLHIDETLDKIRRNEISEGLRSLDGVVSVSNGDKAPHLAVIGYNPHKTNSQDILACVTRQGVHAELIGL